MKCLQRVFVCVHGNVACVFLLFVVDLCNVLVIFGHGSLGQYFCGWKYPSERFGVVHFCLSYKHGRSECVVFWVFFSL